MPYRYLDHEADIGLEASGATAAEALEAGVRGLLSLLVDVSTIRGTNVSSVTATGPDLGALFVALLNAVLARQDIDRQFFRSFALDSLEQTDTGWLASGTLVGEPIDLVRHSLGNEVKAATYSGLRVVECPSQTILRCVLDI